MDYFATQRTGTPCAPYNCAAASGAMGLAFGSGNKHLVSADAFRAQADVSCVPGVHSNSGGLFISDVERVFALHGIHIGYGRSGAEQLPIRWPPGTLATFLDRGQGAVLLGDYDALPKAYRAPGVNFLGDHSAWVHDYRSDGSICWHDPLRFKPIRIPISAAISYWQKPTSPIRGYAGFVAPPAQEEETVIDSRVTANVEGTVTVSIDGAQLVTLDGGRVDIPKGQVRECVAGVALLEPLDNAPGDRTNAWLVGRAVAPVNEPANVRLAYLLKSAAIAHLVKVEVI